jgi:hypothetical protein
MSDSLSLDGGRHHFCKQVLQGRVIEHRIGQKLLQLAVLALEPPQALGLGDFEPADLVFQL